MSRPQLEFSPLLDWVEGRLSPQGAREIELLLDSADEATLATVQWLKAFTSSRRAVTFASPPASTHNALVRRFASYAESRRQPALIQRIAAGLVSDSMVQPAATEGVRGVSGAQLEPRQLVFSCAMADIALNIHRRSLGDGFDLSGQIFPRGCVDPAGWSVLLIGVTGPDASYTDDLGEFSFEAVPAGDYTISLEIGRLAITMPLIALER